MEFDQEMNQAALKIQQHYRNKNTGKKNNLKSKIFKIEIF